MTDFVTPTPVLTTIFKPPASCTNVVTYDGSHFWQGELFESGDLNCYPASFTYARNKFYSPGVCPNGWFSASSVVGTGALVTISTESNALCCPTGYQAIEPSNGPTAGNTIFCGSIIDTPLTNVFSTSTLDIGPLPEDYTRSTTTIDPASITVRPTVWAEVIQVRLQSSDSVVISLQSQQAHSLSSVSASISSASQVSSPPTSSSALPTQTPNRDDGLSTGAKAGIGIGAAAVALLIIMCALFLFNKRRKTRSNVPPITPQHGDESKQQMKSEPYRDNGPEELDGRYTQTDQPRRPQERVELMG